MVKTPPFNQALLAAGILLFAGVGAGSGPKPRNAECANEFVLRIPGAELERASIVLVEAFSRESEAQTHIARGYPFVGHVVTAPLQDEPGVDRLQCIPGSPVGRAARRCTLLSREGDFFLFEPVDYASSRFFPYRIYVVSPFVLAGVDPVLAWHLAVSYVPGQAVSSETCKTGDRALRNALERIGAIEYRRAARP